MAKNEKTILVVEDDENDIFFLELAMQRAKVTASLQIVKNGEDALHYLSGEGTFADREMYPQPTIMLLDLMLPRILGLDVLKWVREHSEFNDLPVIILSSSNQDRNVEKAQKLGADSFVAKPKNPQELVEIVKCIQRYWIDKKRPTADCAEWKAIDLLPVVNATN